MTVVRLTLPVPSKVTPLASTSPVNWNVRPVARAVAVAALPVVEPDVPLTLPVTLPVMLPVNVPAIAPVPVIVGLSIVGLVPKTAAPEPVSSVSAPRRFVLDGVARNVATPVPRPEIPVATGSPVAFVRTPDAGVPNAGVVSIGLVKVLLVKVCALVVPTTAPVAPCPVVASMWLLASRKSRPIAM